MLDKMTTEAVTNRAEPSTPQEKSQVSLLVTDLDNTLWDWFEIWYRSFSALLNEVVKISGIPQKDLEPEIRRVHQLRGTSEYSYLVGELPPLREKHGKDADLQAIYAPAFQAARAAREETVYLYPTVRETLTAIH